MIKIIITLFSINSFAADNYIKKSEACLKKNPVYYSKNKFCGEDCIKIPENYNYEVCTLSGEKIIEDSAKKASYEASELSRTQEYFIKNVISKNIEFGKSLIIDLNYRMSLKGLSSTQVISLDNKMSKIKSLLESGSINTARELMENMEVDLVFNQSDKNHFSQKVSSFLGL